MQVALACGRARLELWGRAGDGWWALIWWTAYAMRMDLGHYPVVEVRCSGWVRADDVARLDGVDYSRVPRTALGVDPEGWPTPRAELGGARGCYFGIVSSRAELPPPDGMRWYSGRLRKVLPTSHG